MAETSPVWPVVLAWIALIVIMSPIWAFLDRLLTLTICRTSLFFDRLIAVTERAEAIARSKAIPTPSLARSVRHWLRLKFLRLCYLLIWLVLWVTWGIALVVVLPVGLYGFFKVFDYTGWVGGRLLGAILVRSWLSHLFRPWLEPFGQIAFCVALGIAPQLLFLCAYNGFKDAHTIPPPVIAWLIHGYEYLSVSLYARWSQSRRWPGTGGYSLSSGYSSFRWYCDCRVSSAPAYDCARHSTRSSLLRG